MANDTIQLDRTVFAAITTLGTLSAAAFFSGTAAHDASDRIIYNAATGNLFYDSDGTGENAAVATPGDRKVRPSPACPLGVVTNACAIFLLVSDSEHLKIHVRSRSSLIVCTSLYEETTV